MPFQTQSVSASCAASCATFDFSQRQASCAMIACAHVSAGLVPCPTATVLPAPIAARLQRRPLLPCKSTHAMFAGHQQLQQNRCFRSHRVARRSLSVSVKAEQSYIMIKPDGVQRALVGEIIHRFERKGFTLKALKMFVPSKQLAEEHYKDLSSKPFFPKLVDYIISGPVVAMVRLNTAQPQVFHRTDHPHFRYICCV